MDLKYPITETEASWRSVVAWAKARIVLHDEQLRVIGLPVDETEGHRYAIQELQLLLKLGPPSAAP